MFVKSFYLLTSFTVNIKKKFKNLCSDCCWKTQHILPGQKNPNPRKTILLEHVPPTAAFSKSPTKSAKNARSSSLNLEKPQTATKAKTENDQKGSRNPPQDHDYCKRNLSDIIEKDYKEADKTQQECKKKAKAPKKRKMTLSEYLQDKNMAKSAPVTPQHGSPRAQKNNYMLKSALTMEPNELFQKKPSALAPANPKFISLQVPSIQNHLSKLKKFAAQQKQGGKFPRVVQCKNVGGANQRVVMNSKPLKVLKPSSNCNQQIVLVPATNGVPDKTRKLILSVNDEGKTDLKDYQKVGHKGKIVETVNKGNIRIPQANLRKIIPAHQRKKYVQGQVKQQAAATRCRPISKELTLQHEIQQTNRRIVSGRKLTQISRGPVAFSKKPGLAIRSSSGQFQRVISSQGAYNLKVQGAKITKAGARNKTIINTNNLKIMSVKSLANLVPLKDLNLSIKTSNKIKTSSIVKQPAMFDRQRQINPQKKQIKIVKLSAKGGVLNHNAKILVPANFIKEEPSFQPNLNVPEMTRADAQEEEVKEEPHDPSFCPADLKDFMEPMMLGEHDPLNMINPFCDDEISKLLDEDTLIGSRTEVHTPAEKGLVYIYIYIYLCVSYCLSLII